MNTATKFNVGDKARECGDSFGECYKVEKLI